jgi:hypothetical protein
VVTRDGIARIVVVRIEDEVVALGVSPGLGDAEAEAGSFEEESGFGEFSFALGVVEAMFGFCGHGLGVEFA